MCVQLEQMVNQLSYIDNTYYTSWTTWCFLHTQYFYVVLSGLKLITPNLHDS